MGILSIRAGASAGTGRGAPWITAAVLGCAASPSCRCGPSTDDALQSGARARSSSPARNDIPIEWSEPITVATGDAHRGPWRMNESHFHYVDDPTVGILDAEHIGVSWVDNRKKDIFFQILDRGGNRHLPRAVNISQSPDVFSWLPRLRVGPDGRQVYVLWQEIVFSGGSHGGEIHFARSTDGGRTFEPPINLSNTPAGDGKGRLGKEVWDNGSLDLALTHENALVAVWTEYEGALRIARSSDGGRTFSAPRVVAGSDEEPARAPSLGVAPGGTLYLAWAVGEHANADIHLAASEDGGLSFDDARVVVDTDGHSDAPRLAVDSKNTAHLVYAEGLSGRRGPYHIAYARLPEGRTAFEPPRRISGPGPEGASFPSLAIGDGDALHVVWDHYPDHRRRPLGLGFAVSTDGGDSFAMTAPIPGTGDRRFGYNGSLQGQLARKLDVSAGMVAVVNSRFDPHRTSRVRLILGQGE